VYHPFVVAIVKKGSKSQASFCTSSLVAPMTVVTAAHCVENKNPIDLKVITCFLSMYYIYKTIYGIFRNLNTLLIFL
jgi:secreted trypsin-like serine protease